ncbi:MAG: nucleoside monophosphate kinase [Candidatus Peribacteraceae bacterium]|nr:nucleoside monophosphate kinase [Candidatus Peribacteraceae bacterium]
MHRPSSYNPDTVTLVSYPGAGKNTISKTMLADLAAQEIPTSYYEAGETVRGHIKRGTEFGLMVKDYSDRGLLVPDEYITPVIREDLAKLETDGVWFLDGFPRTGGQVAHYLKLMQEFGRKDVILNLELDRDPQVSAEIALARIAHRVEQARLLGLPVRKDDLNPHKRMEEAKKLHDVLGELRVAGSKIITIDAKPKPEVVVAQLRQNLAVRILTMADVVADKKDARSSLVLLEHAA